MRLVFAGTPEFAVPALDALVASGHEVTAVLTQPDRPAGRGLAPTMSAVKVSAGAHGIRVLQPDTLKTHDIQAALRVLEVDALVVVAYGLILPQAVLDIPRYGALNIHASLLPRWRGAAPIHRAVLAGDRVTGVSIMQMDRGLDTGPVLLQRSIAIDDEDTAGSLHDKLAQLGATLIVEALRGIAAGTLVATPQSTEGVTYAQKIEKAEAAIDWRDTAANIARRIRAFNPSPGATAKMRGGDVKLWRATVVDTVEGLPGTILDVSAEGVTVACGREALRLEALQRAGGKRLRAAEFVRGFPIAVGDRFEIADTR